MKKAQKMIFVCFACILVFMMSGCGVSHRSPEKVVRSMITAYGKGKAKRVRDCYGAKKDTSEELQKEIDAVLRYLDAHKAKKLKILGCDKISEDKNYSYVYITYNLVLEDDQEYPCIGTYIVVNEDGKYYVVEPSDITEEMSTQAAQDYVKFMTSDAYKEYRRTYDTFVKKNPGYEDKIAERLTE